MEKVYARYNWAAGWIAECPDCNAGKSAYDGTQTGRVAEMVKTGQPFVCSKCYPGIHATMPMTLPNGNGAIVNVPDLGARQRAFARANEEGKVFEVVFPSDMEAIMKELRKRQKRNMSWWPGITLDDLRHENKEHGV